MPMPTMVTDRTAADVDYAAELKSKMINGTATADEVTEYLGGLKGDYNAADLNRVGDALIYLQGVLASAGIAVSIVVRNDWDYPDQPTAAEMANYLQAVRDVKAAISMPPGTPSVPASINGLTYVQANNIEQILLSVDDLLQKSMYAYRHCGALFSICGMPNNAVRS